MRIKKIAAWASLLFLLFTAPLCFPAAHADRNRITHGPILGRPGATSMGVWARTVQPGTFYVVYGTDKKVLGKKSAPVPTLPDQDNTGWVLLDGLAPDTRYHYAVVVGNAPPLPEHTGSFRTLPAPEQYRAVGRNPRGLFNFSFEIGCGNLIHPLRSADQRIGIFDVALEKLAGKIDFAVQTGDFIYEKNSARRLSAAQWAAQAGIAADGVPPVVRVAPTVVGVWQNYKYYLDQSPPLSRWHRHIPGLFMFDDHEILNDVTGTGEVGFRSRAACFRDIGVKAWRDYLGWANPVAFSQGIHFGQAIFEEGSSLLQDPAADFRALDLDQAATLTVHWGRGDDGVLNPRLDRNASPANPNAGVYRIEAVVDKNRLRISPPARRSAAGAYSIGRRNYFSYRLANTEFFFIDTRSHRGLPATGFKSIPGQTMLGKAQRNWLKSAMQASEADFLFVVSSVNLIIPHVGKGGLIRGQGRDEAWTGFMAEREELIAFWEALEKPVLVFSGDLHNSFSIRISERIWEFGAAPHNSGNHNLKSEGGRPINGRFLSGQRECRIRWSTFFLDDTAPSARRQPVFTVVKVNNVFNNPGGDGTPSWVAYPHPQVIVQFFNGYTGDLLYSESIVSGL